jgi:hypothetical protein
VSERYDVKHYTHNFPPHVCATAPGLPELIRVLYGRLPLAERAQVRAALGVGVVVAVAVPLAATVEEAAANLARATDADRHGMPTHNDYSSAGTPSGLPEERKPVLMPHVRPAPRGFDTLDRAG